MRADVGAHVLFSQGAGVTPDDPLRRVEALMEMIATAHTAIFTWHRRVIDVGRDDDRTRDLLGESARIAVRDTGAGAARQGHRPRRVDRAAAGSGGGR